MRKTFGQAVMFAITLTGIGLFVSSTSAMAAESGARTYASHPVGMNVLQMVYQNTERKDQIHIQSDVSAVRYFRTFDAFGNIAAIGGYIPYGKVTMDIPAYGLTSKASGVGDPTLLIGMDFLGAPALSVEEFRQYQQDLIVGGSLQLTMPFGNYSPTQTLNISNNTWVAQPELAISKAFGDMQLEFYGNGTFYSDNEQYLGAKVKGRRAVWGADTHLNYDIQHGSRVSLDYFRKWGGETSINGVAQSDQLEDQTLGFTVHLSFLQIHSLELRYREDIKTRSGNKYKSLRLQYQMFWL